MRAAVCVVLLFGCSRERPRSDVVPPQTEIVADAEVDTLAAALAALEDASGDAPIYLHEARVTSVSVTPKTALTNANDTLSSERWRFRPCAVHVTAKTSASLTIRVGEGGDVVSSTAEAPAALSKCLCDAAQKLKFSEPAGGTASVEVALQYAPR